MTDRTPSVVNDAAAMVHFHRGWKAQTGNPFWEGQAAG